MQLDELSDASTGSSEPTVPLGLPHMHSQPVRQWDRGDLSEGSASRFSWTEPAPAEAIAVNVSPAGMLEKIFDNEVCSHIVEENFRYTSYHEI